MAGRKETSESVEMSSATCTSECDGMWERLAVCRSLSFRRCCCSSLPPSAQPFPHSLLNAAVIALTRITEEPPHVHSHAL